MQVAPLLYQSLLQVVDVTNSLAVMLETAIFDHLFIKSNISAMDTTHRLVVVKFHTNIANRWLFIIQRKKWLSFSIHKVILTCLGGGGRFFRTRCIYRPSRYVIRVSEKIFSRGLSGKIMLTGPCHKCAVVTARVRFSLS